MTGDRLGQDAAYPAASGIRIYSPPSQARRTSRGPAHRVPGLGEADGPARNDADFVRFDCAEWHSAMSTRLDGGLRFAMAFGLPWPSLCTAAKRPPPRRECARRGPRSHPPAKPRGQDHARHRKPGARCRAPHPRRHHQGRAPGRVRPLPGRQPSMGVLILRCRPEQPAPGETVVDVFDRSGSRRA